MIDVTGLRRSIKGFLPATEEGDDWGHQLASEFRSELEAEDSYSLKKSDALFSTNRLSKAFFDTCPGLIGRISKEINHYALQPYPSFAFASACAVVGGLKACYQRSERFRTSPAQYFFCLAPAGKGKDFPRKCMIDALTRSGDPRFMTQKFRSAQGFHMRMSESGSSQVVLHDEAHHFFASSKNSSEHYISALKPMFLELYSGHDKPLFDAGAVLTATSKLPPLIYPTLSYCGFGVPDGVIDTFSGRELTSGFFSRFIIFQDDKEVLPLSESDMAKLPTQFEFETDPEWVHLTETCARFEIAKKTHLARPHDLEFEELKHSSTGLQDYIRYSEIIAERRNALKRGSIDIYNRAVEIVGRIALALAHDEIDSLQVLWAASLVERALPAIELIAYEGAMGEEAVTNEKVLEIIRDAGADGISMTDLNRKSQFIKRERSKVLRAIVKEMELQGILKIDKIADTNKARGPKREVIRIN